MRQLTLRLVIALVTFGLGVAATTTWLAFRTPKVNEAMHIVRSDLSVISFQADESHKLPETRRNNISVGLLNSKAISKPAPIYPAMIKGTHVSGMVTVYVLVDPQLGSVISAHAISGHPLLRQAAVQAAYQAKFSPMNNVPPNYVGGVLTYDFSLQ